MHEQMKRIYEAARELTDTQHRNKPAPAGFFSSSTHGVKET